ncbi:MAG: MBL fold metallo-hydrolase [Synechococcales cyanobacterium RM1_1_8]|nr:MBL fold metallo-hydrolase [Synechococcales cyanobacterium RM1_1_8]
MQIHRLPVLADNYIFLLHDEETNQAAVVDPTQAEPVLVRLKALGAELTQILITHHHWDHVGGNRLLLEHFPAAVVSGGAEDWGRIPGQQVALQGGERISFGEREAQVFFVPGHTRGHLAYYFLRAGHSRGRSRLARPEKCQKKCQKKCQGESRPIFQGLESFFVAIRFLREAVGGCLKGHRLKW